MHIFIFIFLWLISFDLFGCYEQFVSKVKKAGLDLSIGWIEVSVKEQKLRLWKEGKLLKSYHISTATKGTGQEIHSEKTPLGLHTISLKIGDGAPIGTIFRYQKSTRRIWDLSKDAKGQDLILSRVIILKGMERGFNRGFNPQKECVDSADRRIYIHGTAEESLLGTPTSHGCIRMRNSDVIVLYEKVETGMAVWIHEGPALCPPAE